MTRDRDRLAALDALTDGLPERAAALVRRVDALVASIGVRTGSAPDVGAPTTVTHTRGGRVGAGGADTPVPTPGAVKT